jgi:hypothetical protein
VLIRGKFYIGADAINAEIVREDIVDFYLIDKSQAKHEYNIDGRIVGIRTISDHD